MSLRAILENIEKHHQMGILILLHFKESPTLAPIFSTQKNSKEDFCFYEKKQKAKIAFSVCFLAGCYRGNVHPSQ